MSNDIEIIPSFKASASFAASTFDIVTIFCERFSHWGNFRSERYLGYWDRSLWNKVSLSRARICAILEDIPRKFATVNFFLSLIESFCFVRNIRIISRLWYASNDYDSFPTVRVSTRLAQFIYYVFSWFATILSRYSSLFCSIITMILKVSLSI